MKISGAQKLENRKRIIRETVDMILENDFKSTTMRAVARAAGIGDATIYNYFPTKESILYAYYEDGMTACIEKLKVIENFNEYSLQEQLQTFFETELELFLPDREFVQKTFKQVFFSFSQDYNRLLPIRSLFFSVIDEMFGAAAEVGEIEEQVFQEMISFLIWDYNIGIILYWINDESEAFSNTTVFNDKSIDLLCSLIQSGIVNKTFDIAIFLFRNHVLNKMQSAKDRFKTIDFVKRRFMGDDNA